MKINSEENNKNLDLFEKTDIKAKSSRELSIFRFSIVLGLVSVIIAFSIGFFAYRYTLKTTEKYYQTFYLNKAKILASIADIYKDATQDNLLKSIETSWIDSGDKPPDEYICVVDKNSDLILHTAHPDTIGKYVGNNLASDSQGQQYHLHEIVNSQVDCVGDYVSSKGQEQVAAFAAMPQRQWTLGVHRSKDVLIGGIKTNIFYLILGFIIVCGFLLPVSLTLLYVTFRTTNRQRMNAEEELRSLNKSLEQRITERTAELLKTNETITNEINEHKITEGKLNESELRLRELAENITSVFWMEDTDGNLLYTNPAYEQIWGRTCQSFYENPKSWLDAIHPDDRQRVDDSFSKWKFLGKYTEEFRIIRPDGEIRWIQDRGYPIRNKEGEVYRIAGIAEDITERKKMEETLLESEKLKSLGIITAGISHEFNNILAIISGNVQLLEGSRKDDEELTDALRIIKRMTDDGAEISRRMLEFTKTTKDTAGFVSFDINELINVAIGFTMPRWKNMAQSKGINYHMDTEGMKRVPSILCNPTKLREVFVNIIINALDAMPDDGRITFRTWNGGATVFISISDTGEGMPEEVKKNIFDPFFTTRSPAGTGLGMSTAYGIVTGHGGKIEVESKVGSGSTFTLQFPAAAKTDSPKESPEPKQEIKTNSLRILVVYDEKDICNILDKFLSSSGHKAKTVDNGADAINIIKAKDFDLVLCDLAMPDVYGYDVIKALNKLVKRPKIGIITGWGEKLKPPEEEGLKVDFIIKKPFDLSELTKHINDVMNAG